MTWKLRLLGGELAVLRLPPEAATPAWLSFSSAPLASVTRTADELSILCPSKDIPWADILSGDGPSELKYEAGWRAFRVEGKLDFSAVGVLAAILNPLAEVGISILSVSTFDTDYVLVRAAVLDRAKAALRRHFDLLE